MKAEDKFYFGKPGQPEKFLRIDPRSVEQWEASARQRIDSVGPTVWIFVDPSGKEIWLPRPMRFREAVGWLNANQPGAKPNDYYKVAMSRPGQPERFAAPSEDQKQMIRKASKPSSRALSQLRNVVLEYARHATQDPSPLAESDYYRMIRVLEAATRGDRSGVISNGNESGVRDDIPVEIWYWAGGDVLRWSKPGQPDKFDASSLNRGDFAEASTSPMLGKLLAAKVMPEGGWRAVQAGSDTLVISFEDADLARDFGRRVATKGYNATSPVQAIGRYWNVEVKNGK